MAYGGSRGCRSHLLRMDYGTRSTMQNPYEKAVILDVRRLGVKLS